MAEKKKKLPSTFLNMVLVLTVIALVSAMALAFTFSATKEARRMVKVKKTLAAIEKVVPQFDNNPNDEKVEIAEGEFAKLIFYPAKKEGQMVGTAIKTYTDSGFAERIWLMVGFDTDDKIYNISVLEQKETPGLGTKMKDSKFKGQFKGQDPASYQLKVKKDGGPVDAITAATITSRAFCEAVQRAYNAYLKKDELLKQGGKE